MRLFIYVILCFLSVPVLATDYYFSNAGSNTTGAGTALNPYATAAKISTLSYGPGDRFLFKGGNVFYGAFPTLNSGTLNNEVQIDSYGGGQAIISGFTSLPTWSNLGGNIWSAPLSAGSFENVVVSGSTLLAPGRFPNTGWLTIANATSSSFTTTTGTPTAYSGGNVVIKKREWIVDKCPITSVSFQTINFSNVNEFPAQNDWGFIFTDHPTTLDQQNEYAYIATSGGSLRLYSTVDPGTLSMKAATLDALVNLSGKNYIRFNNLIFEGVKGNVFNISGGSGVKVIGCEIRFANRAFDCNFMTSPTITGNYIHDINTTALNAILGSNQIVQGNIITRCAMNETLMGPGNNNNQGIFVNGTGTSIAANQVSYIGYAGIRMGGDNNVCENNYIHHYAQKATDGGGIYLSDESNGVGRIIRNNIVMYGLGERSGTPFPGYDNAEAIYLDEATGGVTVQNNFSAYCAGGGLYLHRAHDCIITGNTMMNDVRNLKAAEDFSTETRITNITFTGNFLHARTSDVYNYHLTGTPSINNFFTTINNNVFSKPSTGSGQVFQLHKVENGLEPDGSKHYDYFPNSYTLAQWKAAHPTWDVNSTGTPTDFNVSTAITQINPGASPITITLNGVYKSIKGAIFDQGTATIAPYSGEVLVRVADLPTNVTIPIKGRINYINF